MISSARIFFAGIGTTFLIIGVGFGGGLMFARSLHDTPSQTRAVTRSVDPVRVILPTTAEAAEAPRPPVPGQAPEIEVAPPEVKVAQKPVVANVEKVDTNKDGVEERTRKKRYAERKARKIARADARRIAAQSRFSEPRVMAFDADEPPRMNLFGN